VQLFRKPLYTQSHTSHWHGSTVDGTISIKSHRACRLKYVYIMLLNLPIVLSSTSFLFYLLFPFLFFLFSFMLPIRRSTIRQLIQLQIIHNTHSIDKPESCSYYSYSYVLNITEASPYNSLVML